MGLPGLFIALSGATLVLALAALFRSLRAAFGDDDEGESAMAVDGAERGSLLEEKKSLLRALKDLEYEHAVGKIDDADFERLNQAYRARARQVLARLDDDLGVHRAAAASLIDSYVSGAAEGEAPTKKKKRKKGKDTKPKPSAQPKSEAKDEPQAKGAAEQAEPPDAEQSEAEADAGALVCPKCETKNDVDATFCKRCAARLSSDTDSSDTDSSDTDSSASDSSEGPSSDSSAEDAS